MQLYCFSIVVVYYPLEFLSTINFCGESSQKRWTNIFSLIFLQLIVDSALEIFTQLSLYYAVKNVSALRALFKDL